MQGSDVTSECTLTFAAREIVFFFNGTIEIGSKSGLSFFIVFVSGESSLMKYHFLQCAIVLPSFVPMSSPQSLSPETFEL